MLARHGSVGTLDKLVSQPTEGLKFLKSIDRLELSAEEIALKPRYRSIVHQAIERGLVDFDDIDFTGRLRQLKAQRLELNQQMQALRANDTRFPPLTASKVREFSRVLRSSLRTGDVRTRRAYIKLFVERITVHEREVQVRGRASTLAEAYAQDWEREVLPQVDVWRPQGEGTTRLYNQ